MPGVDQENLSWDDDFRGIQTSHDDVIIFSMKIVNYDVRRILVVKD